MNLNYSRSGFAEPVRKCARSVDLLMLWSWLLLRLSLPRLKKLTLIELGPGPTRLAKLKRLIFGCVYFVDQWDFNIPDPGFRLCNVEDIPDAKAIVKRICGASDLPTFFFADHFLEHLSEASVEELLQSIRSQNHAACFRVPNILSPQGNENYRRDPTHQTNWSPEFRERIQALGFSIRPWIRIYRINLLSKFVFMRRPAMSVAEEIAIYTS